MRWPDLGLDHVMTVNKLGLGVNVDLENEAVGSENSIGAEPLIFSFFGLGGDFALEHDKVSGGYLLGLDFRLTAF
jgi:hypothetical protein